MDRCLDFDGFYSHQSSLLRAKAVRLSHRNSVCPSYGWISQKQCKLGLPNLHFTIGSL